MACMQGWRSPTLRLTLEGWKLLRHQCCQDWAWTTILRSGWCLKINQALLLCLDRASTSTSTRSVGMVELVYILWLPSLEGVLLRRALKYSQVLSHFLSIAESILRLFSLVCLYKFIDTLCRPVRADSQHHRLQRCYWNSVTLSCLVHCEQYPASICCLGFKYVNAHSIVRSPL